MVHRVCIAQTCVGIACTAGALGGGSVLHSVLLSAGYADVSGSVGHVRSGGASKLNAEMMSPATARRQSEIAGWCTLNLFSMNLR